MARLFPPLEQIRKFRVPPQDGELHLLEFLDQTLDNQYEVYFQPFLNGDRPDIVVMRPGSGVLLIEVKDWNLGAYASEGGGAWYVHSDGRRHRMKSPIEQVKAYRENLFNLHIEQLLERSLQNKYVYEIVACAVYFHRADSARVKQLCPQPGSVKLLTEDSLTTDNLKRLLSRAWPSMSSEYFDDDLYRLFHRHFQPPDHTRNQGKQLAYTEKQSSLSESRAAHQKVRGVAGSGKTKVLARRAVNAHLRTRTPILILTYNITLVNYIHDSLSEIREDFAWTDFQIINYHQFFKAEANNHSLAIAMGGFEDEMFFEPVKNEISKFGAIFIDEIQDYETKWIRLIKRYFLADGGEFVVFGDEKQNIFHKALDGDRRPNTTIIGGWNVLNDSFRSSGPLIRVALEYQDHFFRARYEFDQVEKHKQEEMFTEEQRLRYVSLAPDTSTEQVFAQMRAVWDEWHVHPNDVCVLSKEIAPLRALEYLIRTVAHERTMTMFASKEQVQQYQRWRRLEDSKKRHFWMNPGTVKLSTIHSFKGWEINTLILLIEQNAGYPPDSDDELIYTAITRCRENLLVLNLGNERYHGFFGTRIPGS